MNEPFNIGARMMVPRILWGAFSLSTCLFLGVGFFMQRAGSIPKEPAEPFMLPSLGVVALGCAIASVVLPRVLQRKALVSAKLEVVSEVDKRNGPALFRDAAPTIRVFAKPDEARRKAFPSYFTSFVLGAALSEAVAIYGFVLVMLGSPLLHALPFWLVCWGLMVALFPTTKKVFGPLENAYDAALM